MSFPLPELIQKAFVFLKSDILLYNFSWHKDEERKTILKNQIGNLQEYSGKWYSGALAWALRYLQLSLDLSKERNDSTIYPNVTKIITSGQKNVLIDFDFLFKCELNLKSYYISHSYNCTSKALTFFNYLWHSIFRNSPQYTLIKPEAIWNQVLTGLKRYMKDFISSNYYIAALLQFFPFINGWKHLGDSREIFLVEPATSSKHKHTMPLEAMIIGGSNLSLAKPDKKTLNAIKNNPNLCLFWTYQDKTECDVRTKNAKDQPEFDKALMIDPKFDSDYIK